MFGSILNAVVNEVEEFVDNPIRKVVNTATQPLVDGLDVLEGLTEGEIRTYAALRLGADVVSGMAISEVMELLTDDLG